MENPQSSSEYRYTTSDSTMAIISVIAGILGWSLMPFIGSLVAVITGHMAKKEIRQSNGTLGGDGIATLGLILGYSSIALSLCMCCFVAALLIVMISAFGVSGEFNSLGALSLIIAHQF